MSATQILVAEHDQILKCLDLLETLCRRMDGGPSYPEQAPAIVARFLRDFADRLHHQKEEDILFPAMVSAGMPQEGGPIAVMLSEHEEGRALVGQMRGCVDSLGDEASRAIFVRAGRSFIALLRDHIMKENEILFVMAEGMLSPAQLAEVTQVFDKHGELEAEAYAAAAADLEALEAAMGFTAALA